MRMQFLGIVSLLVIFSFFVIQTLPIFAQEASPSAILDNQATTSAGIKYDLAYPGMLPDNPLYKLKVLRDIVTLALTGNPKNRIDFYLLQTDKGILASAILVDKNNVDLATQTALKAEHNYTLLTQELYKLPQKPDQPFFEKLKLSALKHQEVLTSLANRVAEDKKKTFLTVVDFSKRNWESVEKYQKSDEITQ